MDLRMIMHLKSLWNTFKETEWFFEDDLPTSKHFNFYSSCIFYC